MPEGCEVCLTVLYLHQRKFKTPVFIIFIYNKCHLKKARTIKHLLSNIILKMAKVIRKLAIYLSAQKGA